MKPILAAAALCMAALPVSAQDITDWSDYISPRRVLGALVQYGVVVLRTQTDFTYGGLSLDPVENRATIYDMVMRPQIRRGQDCRITVDRLTLKGAPWSELTSLRVTLGLSGLNVSPGCLPAEAGLPLGILQLRSVSVPQSTIDLRYDLPSGRAEVLVNGMVESVGAVTLEARFDYLAAGPSGRYGGDPTPVATLSSARLQVEDGGAWSRLAPLIPAEFTDPAGGPARSAQVLRLQRGQIVGPGASEAGAAAYDAFVTSIEEALGDFLANPSRLVVETSFDPATPVRLDFDAYALDPARLYADLRPVASVRVVTAPDLPPMAQLAAAMQNPDQVSEPVRRVIGLALLSGEGLPQNRSAGIALLSTLPDDEDGAVTLAIARALATDSPQEAYAAALKAARGGAAGASALLDELEPRLSAVDLFRLQGGLEGIEPGMPDTVLALRDRAVGHFDGKAGRSYILAAYWARLAAAAGDRVSAHLLDDIADRLVALGRGSEWRAEDAKAADRALSDWVALDLPTQLGQTAP